MGAEKSGGEHGSHSKRDETDESCFAEPALGSTRVQAVWKDLFEGQSWSGPGSITPLQC